MAAEVVRAAHHQQDHPAARRVLQSGYLLPPRLASCLECRTELWSRDPDVNRALAVPQDDAVGFGCKDGRRAEHQDCGGEEWPDDQRGRRNAVAHDEIRWSPVSRSAKTQREDALSGATKLREDAPRQVPSDRARLNRARAS